jgi:hypothetical protein
MSQIELVMRGRQNAGAQAKPADMMTTSLGTVIETELPRWLTLSNYIRDPNSDDGEEIEQEIHSLSKTMSGLLAHPRQGLGYGCKDASKLPGGTGNTPERIRQALAEVFDSGTACQHEVALVARALLQSHSETQCPAT